jgi:hypothetical protein
MIEEVAAMRSLPQVEQAATDARSQELCRALNEHIRRIADSFAVDEELELVCECERENCVARLSVSPVEYEAVRQVPARFLTRTEHVGDDERIVYESARYAVVEKIGHRAQTATPFESQAGPNPSLSWEGQP